MKWLSTHAYLAGWLALPLSVVLFFFQNSKSNFQSIDWSRSLIYLAFSISLGVAFTPSFDETARSLARYLVEIGFVFLVVDRNRL